MTNDELTALAADCEARAKAGEKPALDWDSDFYVYRRDGEGDDAIGLLTGDEFGDELSEREWYDDEPALRLFAESLLRAATAPLHAAKVYVVPEESATEKMIAVQNIIGELQAENRRLNTQLQETRGHPLHVPRLRPMAEAPRDGTEILVSTPFGWRIAACYEADKLHVWYMNSHRCEDADNRFSGWLPLPDPESAR